MGIVKNFFKRLGGQIAFKVFSTQPWVRSEAGEYTSGVDGVDDNDYDPLRKGYELIDTVFFGLIDKRGLPYPGEETDEWFHGPRGEKNGDRYEPSKDVNAENVRKSLIDHDGYPADIIVVPDVNGIDATRFLYEGERWA
jgi:hypothetical protein